MNKSPPPYEGTTPVERILDYVTDIYLALKGIAHELEEWNTRPVKGRIFINGQESPSPMTTPTPPSTPIDIPNDDTTASVEWQDRFANAIPDDVMTTEWFSVDDKGDPSTAVDVTATLPTDEAARVTFKEGSGKFQVRATGTKSGITANAESAVYNIVPGAPAQGTIVLYPAPAP